VDFHLTKFWQYIPARGGANFASLILAVVYSRDLGVTNRGIIAAIMSFSVLSIVAAFGGTTLTLRQIGFYELSLELKKSLISLLLLLTIASFILFVSSIFTYSNLKSEIPSNLIRLGLVYFFASVIQFLALEFLLSKKYFVAAAKIEITTVLLQILLYSTLSNLNFFSAAINLLLAFSISYFGVSLYIATKFYTSDEFGLGLPWHYLRETKGKHSLGLALGILDRLDRIFIAWLFPITVLGQYATMSGFLSAARFFPDAVSRIRVAGYKIFGDTRLRKPELLALLSVLFGILAVLSARNFISWALGPEWLLPIPVFAFFCAQELARGLFQFLCNSHIKNDQPLKSHRASLTLVLLILPALLIFTHVLGIVGVPIAFFFCYVISILIMSQFWKMND